METWSVLTVSEENLYQLFKENPIFLLPSLIIHFYMDLFVSLFSDWMDSVFHSTPTMNFSVSCDCVLYCPLGKAETMALRFKAGESGKDGTPRSNGEGTELRGLPILLTILHWYLPYLIFWINLASRLLKVGFPGGIFEIFLVVYCWIHVC